MAAPKTSAVGARTAGAFPGRSPRAPQPSRQRSTIGQQSQAAIHDENQLVADDAVIARSPRYCVSHPASFSKMDVSIETTRCASISPGIAHLFTAYFCSDSAGDN